VITIEMMITITEEMTMGNMENMENMEIKRTPNT
jgi:hypothetical protein